MPLMSYTPDLAPCGSPQSQDLSLLNRTHSVHSPTFSNRRIVTSFLCTFNGTSFQDFKVAIFKRSQKANSHR
jgi:hypothetical protein